MAFQELVQTLHELLGLYNTLYEIGAEKKDHIIKNRVDEITACVSKESKLLKTVTDLENARRTAVIKLQRDIGVRPRFNMPLTEIGRMLTNPDQKQEIARIQQELNDSVGRLRQINELNQQLIQQSIEFVAFSMDLMFGPPDEEVVYKKPTLQQQAQTRRTSIFDSRG